MNTGAAGWMARPWDSALSQNRSIAAPPRTYQVGSGRGTVITASAATVIVGLGSMAFGQFQMIQTTGPALAIAIFVTLIAGLTFTPALLGVFGHYLFWPMHERDESTVNPRGFFVRLAGGVSRRPALVGAVLLVALLVPVSGITAMRSNFDAVSDLPSTSDARVGFDLVAQHLGKGRIMPVNGVIEAGPGTDLLAPASLARLRDVTEALATTPGATATPMRAVRSSGLSAAEMTRPAERSSCRGRRWLERSQNLTTPWSSPVKYISPSWLKATTPTLPS
jgi:uncharacterized membrane protein YdfJ with MMPL/SSD domain